ALQHRELHRLIEDVLDDVVVAFVAPRDRVAGSKTDEWLFDLHDRMNRVCLRCELARKRKPRLAETQLPCVVATATNEKVAVDAELQFECRTGDAVESDDEIVVIVIERQRVSLLVSDRTNVVCAERQIE